jgi:RimJ/RimL family protein N-acetyltransferase/ketosteroid isomerase-like protein
MTALVIQTARLRLVLESTEAVLARIEAMSPADRAEVSPDWLKRMRTATPSPWTHGFALAERETGAVVGACGYKGPPDADGVAEIAYGVDPDHRGRGYAKEAAAALIDFALGAGVRIVRAHTRPENSASGRVLDACGLMRVGEVIDPEDGLVWRWELGRCATPASLRTAWIAAVAARDAEALRPLLTDDYEVWANATAPLCGAEAAVAAMRGALERYHIQQSFEPVETVIAGDWAFERGLERMSVTPIGGGPTQTMTQRALLVLRRGGDGQWRYARGMTNGLPTPPPESLPTPGSPS